MQFFLQLYYAVAITVIAVLIVPSLKDKAEQMSCLTPECVTVFLTEDTEFIKVTPWLP